MAKLTSDLLRGHTDTMVLKLLHDKDMYGYEIVKEIFKRSNDEYELKEITLYSSLKRLQNDEFITSYWGDESKEDYGTLYTDNDGLISHKVIPSKAGNYGIFYEKMADAILNNAPVPTSAKEGTNIIRVLEAARNSAFNKRVVGV